jgi:hypothetical protein
MGESSRARVAAALNGADVFFGSLLFDFDQVLSMLKYLSVAVGKFPDFHQPRCLP